VTHSWWFPFAWVASGLIPLGAAIWIKRRDIVREWDSDPDGRPLIAIEAVFGLMIFGLFGPMLLGLVVAVLAVYGLVHLGIRLLRHGIIPEGATDLRTDRNHPKGVR
jgi:hypothetical protein